MALALLGGCAHERVLAVGYNYTLSVIGGDKQSAAAGSTLSQTIAVAVRDVAGVPVKAAVIVFRVTSGGGADGASFIDSLAVTDDAGKAEATLRLGAMTGVVGIRAFPQGAEDRGVALTATATNGAVLSAVTPLNVGPGDTLVLTGSVLGGVLSSVDIGPVARVVPVSGSETELRVVVPDCLPGGALNIRVRSGTAVTASRQVTYASRQRPLSLRPYEAAVIGASELATCAALQTATGAEFVLTPQFAAQGASPTPSTVRVTVGGAQTLTAVFGRAPGGAALRAAAPDVPTAFDAMLRAQEKRLVPLARGGGVYAPPMLALTLGSLRTFRVVSNLAGTAVTDATGRLQYLGTHLAIYVDTTTPTAFADTTLAHMGKLFDSDLYGVVTTSFGPEPDIDQNGKVLLFLTPRVNALVSAADCGQFGFVTGFFAGRDLLPTAENSNAGEIFYAMVPDITARFSCAHTDADVQRLLSGTFVHEFQHLVSFFHHVVARGGDAEEPWVNEGLSHISEELASKLFERRYPAPLQRSVKGQLFPDSSSPFITPQMLNSYIYLNSSANHSVTTWTGSGSIEERGAAWLFLRWLADQKGEGIFQHLVQTSMTGMANVEARAGEPFARLFGDFSVAIWADSIAGVPRTAVAPRYRFLSRNLRQLMAREAVLAGFQNAFPVAPLRMATTGLAEGSLLQGTMVFLAFGPFADGQPSSVLSFVRSDGVPFLQSDGAQLSIFRVR